MIRESIRLERKEQALPNGPNGETRPADTIGAAIRVARIATGEIENDKKPNSGLTKSGKACAAKLSKEERSAIAKTAAEARWSE